MTRPAAWRAQASARYARSNRPARTRYAFVVSVALHAAVLLALARFAGGASGPATLEVFATGPIETTPARAVVDTPIRSRWVRVASQRGRSPSLAPPRVAMDQPAITNAVVSSDTTSARTSTVPRADVVTAPVLAAPGLRESATAESASAPAHVETPAAVATVVALRTEQIPASEIAEHAAPPSSPMPASTLEPVGVVSTAVTSAVAQPRASEPEAMPALPEMTTAQSPRSDDGAAARPSIAAQGARLTRGPALGNAQQRAPSSPLGLGLVRMRIRLDGASTRTTARDTDVISGTLIGGTPRGVAIDVDGRQSEPTLDGRLFTSTVKLLPGLNHVRVLATDALGAQVEETVTVDYVPPLTADITLTSPHDGETLTPGAPPLITVEGEVHDSALTAVWLVANDRRVSVPVSNGRFGRVVPVLEPVVRIRAETGVERRGSATVTVRATATLPPVALALLDWPRDAVGPIDLGVSWRANPARLEGVRALPLNAVNSTGSVGLELAYLRDARPGVYTFFVTYRAGTRVAIRPVLSFGGAAHTLAPMTLDGSGRTVIGRVLLPQGVLWEQDDWFTGRSASGDIVTKFRFPDGVSWSERVGDAAR